VLLMVTGIGKLRDAAIDAACDEYVRRARAFLPLERTHVPDLDTAITRARAQSGPCVLLDERGNTLDSHALASWLGTLRDAGTRRVTFVIGDADGFTAKDRARADRLLSLSKLTLPHRLAHLVLCEQLYRAGTILAGHPYHH
jgi:23S rRNA (pseudouridine1915-N3)-methyltransferase